MEVRRVNNILLSSIDNLKHNIIIPTLFQQCFMISFLKKRKTMNSFAKLNWNSYTLMKNVEFMLNCMHMSLSMDKNLGYIQLKQNTIILEWNALMQKGRLEIAIHRRHFIMVSVLHDDFMPFYHN